MTLTMFRAGNSEVIAIPRELREKYGWKLGSKIDLKDTGKGVAIEPLSDSPKVSLEFKKWLDSFEKKYDKSLRELAKL